MPRTVAACKRADDGRSPRESRGQSKSWLRNCTRIAFTSGLGSFCRIWLIGADCSGTPNPLVAHLGGDDHLVQLRGVPDDRPDVSRRIEAHGD